MALETFEQSERQQEVVGISKPRHFDREVRGLNEKCATRNGEQESHCNACQPIQDECPISHICCHFQYLAV